jgi:hypothetical protein
VNSTNNKRAWDLKPDAGATLGPTLSATSKSEPMDAPMALQ